MMRSRLAMLLSFLFFLVATASLGVAVQGDTAGSGHHHPPLLDCAPAPPSPSADDDRAFRANLASALGALPSAAAAAPKGFAIARSGGADRAVARGLCFGTNATSSPAAARACLYAAASDVTTAGRCGGSRRAGVWRSGCFLAYADTDAPSPREAAFRGWFYAGPNTTAAALADRVCAGDRTAAECGRCFEDAARAAAELGWLARIRGQEVLVVGYDYALRVQISVLPEGPIVRTRGLVFYLWMESMILIEAAVLIEAFCVIITTLVLDAP